MATTALNLLLSPRLRVNKKTRSSKNTLAPNQKGMFNNALNMLPIANG